MVRRRIWAASMVGVYIETKEPVFHVRMGLDLEPRSAVLHPPILPPIMELHLRPHDGLLTSKTTFPRLKIRSVDHYSHAHSYW